VLRKLIRQARSQQIQIAWLKAKLEKAIKRGFSEDRQ
jgi:hypothetical protein